MGLGQTGNWGEEGQRGEYSEVLVLPHEMQTRERRAGLGSDT